MSVKQSLLLDILKTQGVTCLKACVTPGTCTEVMFGTEKLQLQLAVKLLKR